VLFCQFPLDILLVFFFSYKVLIIEFLNHTIEDPDHLGGEINELVVKFPIKLSQVRSLNHKHFGLPHVKVEHLISVDLFSDQLTLDLLDHFELVDELDERFLGTDG
jgi:hypothetical protein